MAETDFEQDGHETSVRLDRFELRLGGFADLDKDATGGRVSERGNTT